MTNVCQTCAGRANAGASPLRPCPDCEIRRLNAKVVDIAALYDRSAELVCDLRRERDEASRRAESSEAERSRFALILDTTLRERDAAQRERDEARAQVERLRAVARRPFCTCDTCPYPCPRCRAHAALRPGDLPEEKS